MSYDAAYSVCVTVAININEYSKHKSKYDPLCCFASLMWITNELYFLS